MGIIEILVMFFINPNKLVMSISNVFIINRFVC